MSNLRSLLSQKKIRPQKILGQNFLIHSHIAKQIIDWANISIDKTVVEIGPGLGALTEELIHRNYNVIAIEKDPILYAVLKEKWNSVQHLHLMNADACFVDYKKLADSNKTKLVILSNLPYSISTVLLEKLLQAYKSIEFMALLFQEEVTNRIAAKVNTPDYGRLSIWVQSLCHTDIGFRISNGNFYPKPKVQSRLVRLVPREISLVPSQFFEHFLTIVSLLFQHRRKSVKNSLKCAQEQIDSENTPHTIEQALQQANISPERRPQTLSIQELALLASFVKLKSNALK